MAIHDTTMTKGPLVLVTEQNGVTVIPQPTPLTRLNYFDGKFLRASDLTIEQLYLRRLMDLSNQAGGAGVAFGYSLSLAANGNRLDLCPGLAIDPEGRVLLLPQPFSVDVQELIDRSRQVKNPPAAAAKNGGFAECTVVVVDTPPGTVVQAAGDLYLIVIGFAEALCGQEDVFGKLCESACATSTDRPFLVEGLVIRAVPLALLTPLPTSSVVALSQLHLRSRVASSYFEDERRRVASFISGEGLRSNIWCLGAEAAGGKDVPIGVLARAGATTVFLDAWTARRERIDAPAKRYWQWRMAMRPWDVFLAQILQFQCQLSDLFHTSPPAGGDDDPCAPAKGVIQEAAQAVNRLATFYQTVTSRFTLQPLLVDGTASDEPPPVLEGGLAALLEFQKKLQTASDAALIPSTKVLIDGGIVEVPSAGYLPVTPSSVVTVNQQVRRLLGRGVDLRFCIVRPDFVAHALEEAQHMERISLLEGLDHPDRKPEVDILVPNGEAAEPKLATGVAYESDVRGGSPPTSPDTGAPSVPDTRPVLRGAAHIDVPESGNVKLYSSVGIDPALVPILPPFSTDRTFTVSVGRAQGPSSVTSFWGAVTTSLNPFTALTGGQLLLDIRVVIAIGTELSDIRLNGTVTFQRAVTSGTKRVVKGIFDGTLTDIDDEGDESNSHPALEVTAILDEPEDKAPSLRVTLLNKPINLAAEILLSWSGSPRKVTFSLALVGSSVGRIVSGQTRATMFDAVFTLNEDVLLPANRRHVSALKVLDTLGGLMGDAQFPPKSAALLFPPLPPAADDLEIRPVLDWVLFHRRRIRRCQVEIVAPAVQTRRYQVWHGAVAHADAMGTTVNALRSNGPFDPEGVIFKTVDVVEFAPGIQTLISSNDAIEADWKKVKPGPQLMYGGIASRDAAKEEGPALAKGRLGEVQQAVAAISPPVEAVPLEVLDAIHPDLDVPGVDGIIVALTPRQTTCVSVYYVSGGAMQFVFSGIANANANANADPAGIENFLNRSTFMLFVGQVQFSGGTDAVVNNSLAPVLQGLAQRGLSGQEPNTSVVLVRAANPNVPAAIAVSQGRIIQIGAGPGEPPTLLTTPLQVPNCPVVLFMSALHH